MPRFQILPRDNSAQPIEIDCVDAGSALYTANQIGCHEADILEEGLYVFSVRTLGGKSSFWQIFQRKDGAVDPVMMPPGQGTTDPQITRIGATCTRPTRDHRPEKLALRRFRS